MADLKKKDQAQPTARKMERTGLNTFSVKHDDGSVFECQVDDPKRFDSMSGVSGNNKKTFLMSGLKLKKKPLICDECNKRVYKIRMTNGKSLCDRCS